MIETPTPLDERNATEQSHATEQSDEENQSEEVNARAKADAQIREHVEDQKAPTLGDIGSLED